ncbi:hypothetical protein SLS58_005086 [Diplodia intermedia]|uniref:Transglycosylase SLT domain-containing protein n=1 Tax=Diplodia intermedia TaxID=856260 RepID=A0ABR3TSS0_9PEZI
MTIHLTTLLLLLATTTPAALALALPTSLSPRAAAAGYFENSIVTNPSALAWYSPADDTTTTAIAETSLSSSGSGSGGSTSAYQCFTSSTYPPITSWLPFATLWTAASPGIAAANADTTSSAPTLLHTAIIDISRASSVDARLILATILQESGGALAAPCTGTGNCGVMQAAPGSAGYDATTPAASVERMLRDGVQGVAGRWPAGGPGLAYWLGVYGEPWRALRAYNTGSVPVDGDLRRTGGVGTASYVVDVANRLVGWDGVNRGSC